MIYKEKVETTSNVQQRALAEQRGVNYLKRYFYLIVFTAYLIEQSKSVNGGDSSNNSDSSSSNKNQFPFKQHFEEWMQSHKELYSLMELVELK